MVQRYPETEELLTEVTGKQYNYINLLKPTGHVMHQQVLHSTILRSANTVLMCFVFL
jgi:hypothetical protein